MKRSPLAVLATLALVLGLSGPASAANAKPVCPPGYLGTETLDEALVRLAGFFTEDEIRAGFAAHDKNGNGFTCRKHPPAFDKEKFFPLELIIDDLDRGSA